MTAANVTVVVLTHERRREVLRTVARVLDLPEQPEVVVVDNASRDGTAQAVRTAFPSVRLVRAPSNLGAAGRNLGVAAALTDYVAFCDDDTCWEPGALAAAARILDAALEVAVLNARVLVGPQGRLDPTCEEMARSPLGEIPGVGPRLAGFMAGACVMRRHAYLEAGGYDARYFIGGEEDLLALDILDRGHAIAYAPALATRHWPSRARDAGLRGRHLARNAIWTAWLRLPWAMALARTVRVLDGLPGLGPRLRALGDALAGYRMLRGERRVAGRRALALWTAARERQAENSGAAQLTDRDSAPGAAARRWR